MEMTVHEVNSISAGWEPRAAANVNVSTGSEFLRTDKLSHQGSVSVIRADVLQIKGMRP